jgi:NarL family two-component system sensor histidine kinase YdfH
MADIAMAARRALDESRGVIAALVRPTDEPLEQALSRVADEAAERWGTRVDSHADTGLELAPPAREALLRIVGEAVTNAARHAKALHIRVELSEHPELHVFITDDGVGFDLVWLAQQSGRHGIVGMRERAEQIGGQLRCSRDRGTAPRYSYCCRDRSFTRVNKVGTAGPLSGCRRTASFGSCDRSWR